ncbi:hypothetical protein EDD22DRAFT_772441 [Suillus occidentalis]|nr:hypothetical protein EDD22DRAFT_772441 [Suillus occidentalis]
MTRRQVRDTRKPRKRYEIQWSDTCCIEKSDHTELDDSIRSILRWYRNSTICIAHLAQSETLDLVIEWRGWAL